MATHGGKRAGSGRKPITAKALAARLPKEAAQRILEEIDAPQIWVRLANSEAERIALDTMKYLTDRAYGKAPQAVSLRNEDDQPLELVVRHIGR